MTQAKTQFERVQRAFMRVLNNRARDPVEYEDDVWAFFQNCWHLKDWIKSDRRGVAKATRQRIEVEVNSYPALVRVGKLTCRSEDLEVAGGAAVEAGQEIAMTVVDEEGDEIPVKQLATEAMKNWMAIIKKYRI